jgi:hypothetical protein
MNENKLIINQVAGANIIEYELDLFESVPIPIVKSINDIENIAERKSDFSKTITLPGTQNNNDIFSSIFNLNRSVVNTNTYNFAPDFNPSLKADAILYKNGVVILQGYLQLVNINVVDDYEIEYEVIIIGRTANLFQDLGERKLNQLDLSAYNHTWNFTNIQASWTPSAARGYYYGLIDKGLSNNQQGFFTKDQKPQIYAKTIIDAIFNDAGYRYSSLFFTSGNFTQLVVPTTQNKLLLTQQEVTDRTFKGNRLTNSASTALIDFNGFLPFVYNSLSFNNTSIQSTPSGYDPTLSKFTIATAGFYQFGIDLSITNTLTGVGTLNRQEFHIIKTSGATTTVIGINNIIKSTTAISATTTSSTYYIGDNVFCNVGDVIEVKLLSSFSGVWNFSLLTNSSFFSVPFTEITVGDTMQLENCLPTDIKQADFLMSIIKMFNLYVQPDPLDDKKLLIETRDVFFNNTIVDITDKIDVSRGVEIMPLGSLKYKEYVFTMQEDKDELNELYQKQYVDPYGTLKVPIENDFVTEIYKTDVIFAPTPLDAFLNNPLIVTSRIIFMDSNGNIIDSTSKLRLLVAGGLSPTIGTNYFHYEDPNGTKNYFSAYPYVGHYDNIANPTLDINFTNPIQLFYNTGFSTNQTSNNIYNLYHKKGIEEITNKDSKLVIFYVKLSEVEINNLSFRDSYFIDKQFYRLYEVDFDSNSQEPAKLTFLKLAVAPTFIPYNLVTNGGGGGLGSTYEQMAIRNGTQYPKGVDVLAQGNSNTLQGYEQLVNSDNNFVNGNKVNVLGGENNIVINDNVTLINCEDYLTNRDGQAVTNNIDQPLLATRVLTIAELSSLNTTPIEILPKQDGFWTEVYDAYITVFFGATSPKTGYNNHKLHLQYNGDGTHLLEFDNGITAKTTATKLRGINVYDLPFKELAVEIHSQGNLGAAGNSEMLIELEYRLHPIIN